MKIILFYSSIGQGHLSAINAIEKDIRSKAEDAIIIKKDIRDFMNPIMKWLDEKSYWFVAKHCSELFDYVYQKKQEGGQKIGSLTSLSHDYNEQKVCEFIKSEAPDSILASHYGAAQVLGNLREQGMIDDIKLGWIHTDYIEGYFPRISKRLDRTFLAHTALADRWLKAGVFPDLIDVSGIPIQLPLDENMDNQDDSTHFYGKTITIACGKEGVCNFSEVVLNLIDYSIEPLKINAVCGRNRRQLHRLKKLQSKLPLGFELNVFGFISQKSMISLIRASNVYITKAGGLSPTEAFIIGKPTILLNSISGHESENATFFSELQLAKFNTDRKKIGLQTQEMLQDIGQQKQMLAAQHAFRLQVNTDKIIDFLMEQKESKLNLFPHFGMEFGRPASNTHVALEQLAVDAPADIELLLSYSSAQDKTRIAMENPFGHIALCVGDTIYSSNHRVRPGKEPLLQGINQHDFLFGVVPPSANQIHTSTYGMVYGRDTLGLRVTGIAPETLRMMHAAAEQIEAEFTLGKIKYNVKKSNCADYVKRIFQQSGYTILPTKSLPSIYSMPLDVFEEIYAALSAQSGIKVEMVGYRRLPGSRSAYGFSHFPYSFAQPGRSLSHIVRQSKMDKLELKVDKQLAGAAGNGRVYYERLSKQTAQHELIDQQRIHYGENYYSVLRDA